MIGVPAALRLKSPPSQKLVGRHWPCPCAWQTKSPVVPKVHADAEPALRATQRPVGRSHFWVVGSAQAASSGSAGMARFQLQLRWYMQAVAAAEGRPVHGRLVLADIETGATKLLDVPHEPEKTLEDLVRRTRTAAEKRPGWAVAHRSDSGALQPTSIKIRPTAEIDGNLPAANR